MSHHRSPRLHPIRASDQQVVRWHNARPNTVYRLADGRVVLKDIALAELAAAYFATPGYAGLTLLEFLQKSMTGIPEYEWFWA